MLPVILMAPESRIASVKMKFPFGTPSRIDLKLAGLADGLAGRFLVKGYLNIIPQP